MYTAQLGCTGGHPCWATCIQGEGTAWMHVAQLGARCPAWMYGCASKLGNIHPSKLGLQVGWMSASLDTPYHLIWNFWLGCRTELQQVGACPTRPGFFIETLFNSRRVLRILCVMTFLLECYPKRNQIISSTSRIGSLYFDLLE